MLKEKEQQLKKRLKKILLDVGHIKDVKQKIGKEFRLRNIPAHRAMNVFINPDYLFTLNSSEKDIRFLFLFTMALNNIVNSKIDLREYFTKVEYKQWINYEKEEKADSIFPIVFENTQQLADKVWQTTISAQRLATLDTSNVFLYNFKTQRRPKITVSGIKIDFDKRKAFEIRNNMLEGNQYPDHIKINILNDFREKISYNDRTQKLIVGEGSTINIFDGHHRKVANSLAVEKNPKINFTWGLIITNLSETAAKDYMVQIDKQKPIKRKQIEAWDFSKKENLVVSVIADDKISKLSKVMKDQDSEVKLNMGLTTRNVIARAVKENYKIDNTTDIRGLGNWIVEFIDYLMMLYPTEFITDPYKIKEESMINDKNIFYGYIALSAKLKNNPMWKELTKQKMQRINFSKHNQVWRKIGVLNKNDINKASRKKLYSYFVEEV